MADELIQVVDGDREFEFAMSARLRHGPLWRVCQKFGTQAAAARELGITPTQLNQLVNLRYKKPPIHAYWWPEFTKKLAALTGMLTEDLFPDWIGQDLLDLPLTSTRYQRLSLDDVRSLPAPSEPLAIGNAIDSTLRKTLSAREKLILDHRFGLNGQQPKTLRQVAELIGRTPELVRSIEAKALRRLQQPENAEQMADAVGQELGTVKPCPEVGLKRCARMGCNQSFLSGTKRRRQLHPRYCSAECQRRDERDYPS